MANFPRIAAICLVLAVLTVGAFWQLKDNNFVNYDDIFYLTENSQVQGGLSFSGLRWAFTATVAGNWHPLTWLSHMLDWQLYGANPSGHHLTSLILHVLNTLLLFWVLVRLTQGFWPSALVAALFALHPLHVESVAWASERKDVLSAFFWLLTMWTYLRYVERPKTGRYLSILLVFALGLMAKAMLVTEPFMLLLLDYWPLGRWSGRPEATGGRRRGKAAPELGPRRTAWRLIWEKTPLFALAAISCVITVVVQREAEAVISTELLPFGARLSNALVAYVSYLAKMLWPLKLAIFYPHPGANLPGWQIVGAGVLLAGFTSLAVHWRRRFPYLLVGWLWYLGTLVPVIGLVQVGSQAMADRYTYIPFIGIFIILAFGAADLASGWRSRQVTLAAVWGLALLTCLTLTWVQVGHWRNATTLFSHALQVTENNYMAYVNLGLAYDEAGKTDAALEMLQQGMRLKPNFADTYNDLGKVYDKLGRTDEAIEMFRRAIGLNPNFCDAYNNLGIDLADRGEIAAAIHQFQQARRARPDFDQPYYNLGLAYSKQGQIREAGEMFEMALKKNPNNVGARDLLASIRDR